MEETQPLDSDKTVSQEISPAVEAASPVIPVAVSECGLQLRAIHLVQLILARADISGGFELSEATIGHEAKLKPDSLSQNSFVATVNWSLSWKENPAPLVMSGRHELLFSTEKNIRESDASYYSEVNSVILLFPYIRQIVEDVTLRSLGRGVLISPLDVPKHVADYWKRKLTPPSPEKVAPEPENDNGENAG